MTSSASVPAPHHPPAWAVALAFGVGLLVAAQSRINGQLALEVRDGLLAAVLSFLSGLLVVVVITFSRRSSRTAVMRSLPRELREGRLRWWHLLGGIFGALYVAAQSVTVPLLGVALFSVLAVAGTTTSSLLTDRAGIGPGGRRPVTARRVVASVGTVLAVLLAVSGRISAGDLAVWALVLAVVAGLGTGVQPALNGQVSVRVREPLAATTVNMAAGSAALVLALAVEHLVVGHDWQPPTAPWHSPVLWLGGIIGVTFILTGTIVVRPLGVLLLTLVSTAGQLTGSLLSDLLLPTPGTVVTWQLVTGVALTGVAVAFAAVRPRAARGSG